MTHTISNNFITVKINTLGAEVQSLKNKNREYIWNGNPIYWAKHAPVLFPIVGTLKDNCYFYDNKKYFLSRHGFARNCQFELIHQKKDTLIFSLLFNEVTLNVFPFKFELQIKYTLQNKSLCVCFDVINKDIKSIPFSIGAHPAFALQQNIKNYSLLFEDQEILESFELKNDLISNFSNKIVLRNKTLPLNYDLFKNDALIFKKIVSKKITILENDVALLDICYKSFKNFGIWTTFDAPFICLEPWLGYSDATAHDQKILHKEGIQIVKENCTFTCSYAINIS